MPLYDVEHVVALTADQQERLARAFTDLHSTRFRTPRFFLNVRYTDCSGQIVFRNGRRAVYNRVILRTRAGEQHRSKELYDEHCRDVIKAWEDIVGREGELGLRTVWVMAALTTAVECGIARPKVSDKHHPYISYNESRNLPPGSLPSYLPGLRQLRFLWHLFFHPPPQIHVTQIDMIQVGEEDEWLKTNMGEFRKLAAAGDEDFVELVQELDSRGR
ncbi:hypothetical protein FOPE_07083 [Fonsecaea pedrosoi]|nr:hypothetical protein FOPE_07083 [Fonsecaea pedrosoi]